MKKLNSYIIQAGRVSLLAFFISTIVKAQEIQNLSGANSPQDDQNPVWIGDGVLLFTRANHFQNLGGITDPGDIWMTKKDADGNWSEATHRPDLSTSGYDIALGLEDLLTLLVYHQGSERNGIFQYSKFGSDWNFLRPISMEGLSDLEGKISGRVAKGGKLIFLSGKREDSRGNEDIYVSEKIAPVQWSIPKHLGNVINTPGQEISPFFDPDSNLLYFSSNMQVGAEGKDIFIAKKLSDDFDQWSAPEKWVQLNSAGSESSVTFISDQEVVWTTTQNSDGFADLVTFKEPVDLEIPAEFEAPSTVAIAQTEQNESTTKVSELKPIFPSNAVGIPEVRLEEKEVAIEEEPLRWLVIDQKNRTRVEDFTVYFGEGVSSQTLDSRTIKLSDIQSNANFLRFEAPQFFPVTVSISSLRTNEPNVILMTRAEAGNSLLLDQVGFKRGTSELEGSATMEFLDQIAKFLNENPEVIIRISGHTDNAGDPGLNKALSLDRATSVRDYLFEKGVAFERLRISGWGGTRPIASNATEAGRSKNRRVEITVEN
ncbi:OmpA family protein [Algoriphagus limi]|uniref:OmpA family protein n=1 Tax=Algoriphagus limi TaxID=2975273 RepID=A0ABT2G6D0_9BACT|nr:OmpA family protein [Algoriphagus limi]MCS5489580.1 OmpA family protein [Algoriphagus limi]